MPLTLCCGSQVHELTRNTQTNKTNYIEHKVPTLCSWHDNKDHRNQKSDTGIQIKCS